MYVCSTLERYFSYLNSNIFPAIIINGVDLSDYRLRGAHILCLFSRERLMVRKTVGQTHTRERELVSPENESYLRIQYSTKNVNDLLMLILR